MPSPTLAKLQCYGQEQCVQMCMQTPQNSAIKKAELFAQNKCKLHISVILHVFVYCKYLAFAINGCLGNVVVHMVKGLGQGHFSKSQCF